MTERAMKEQGASFGPVLYIGLTVLAIMTQAPQDDKKESASVVAPVQTIPKAVRGRGERPTSGSHWVLVTGDFVNLRRGPGVQFAPITQYNTGDRLLVTGTEGRWSRVNRYGGPDGTVTGWMWTGYLKPEEQ